MFRHACIAYVLLGLGLWPVPLLNVLQVESAAVVAFVSFFVAGWASIRQFQRGRGSLWGVLGRQELALLVPLVMLLVAQLWAPNCTLDQGLVFYGLFPGVTVGLAVALAYLLTGASLQHPFAAYATLGVIIVVGGVAYDLGLHPQLYTYNHVFGGVLGPIYDEQLAIRGGLFAFRGLTVLLGMAAACAGALLRGRGHWGLLLLCLMGIAAMYGNAERLGINTSADTLKTALGGHHRTSHFDIYYDPSSLDPPAVKAIAQDHEAHYRFLRDRLEAAGEGERIESYLYPDPDTKGQLTGARTTSVAPVWLVQPQVHLLDSRVEASLGHELAHVLSRSYGLPLLRASWAPGLVEGWAVALEPPAPGPSPHDLVGVALSTDTLSAGRVDADAVADRLSPWGFWTGRGLVSYAAMGSFVDYLLRTYGADRLKRVYAWADFEAVYGRSLRRLAAEWEAFVRGQPVVSIAAHDVVTRRFTQPSLFETNCPHYVSPPRRHLQEAGRALRQQDTARAERELVHSLELAPQYGPAHALRAALRLADGDVAAVRTQLDTLDDAVRSARLRRLQGDAHALSGHADTARVHYSQALSQTPRSAPDRRARLMLREATAARPEVVRILTGGDSAHVQARRLEAFDDGPVGATWQALRWHDAHRYARAANAWRGLPSPLRKGAPEAWHRTWAIQRRAWGAEAAARSGRAGWARTWAAEGALRADALGASAWQAVLRRWGERAGEMSRE